MSGHHKGSIAAESRSAKSLAWSLNMAVWLSLIWATGFLAEALLYALEYRSTTGSEDLFVTGVTGLLCWAVAILFVLALIIGGFAVAWISDRMALRARNRHIPSAHCSDYRSEIRDAE